MLSSDVIAQAHEDARVHVQHQLSVHPLGCIRCALSALHSTHAEIIDLGYLLELMFLDVFKVFFLSGEFL